MILFDIFLLKNNSDMTSNSELTSACEKGDYEAVKGLIDGQKKNEQSDAFVRTVEHGHFEIVKLFVATNAVTTYAKNTALTVSIKFDRFEIMKYLVGLDFLRNDPVKDVALFEAAKFGKFEMVKWLVEDAKSDIHFTHNAPTRIAFRSGYMDVGEYLKALGGEDERT